MSFERKNILNMLGYVPGEQPKLDSVIKLNTNENPYPASPDVAAALAAIDVAELRRYPQALAEDFRATAANLHGVQDSNIIPTNGGDELLRLALTTFVEAEEIVAVTQPSYSLYPVLAEVQNCNLVEIPLEENWTMPEDFARNLNSLDAKMCILVNPHAPTGALLCSDYLSELATQFNGVLIIDEAYVDFVEPELKYDCVPLVSELENLLILRSLSKGYSLAGLRFGYGIASESLANPIMFKTRDSYNTDYIAQKLACTALESREYVEANWARIRLSRSTLASGLQQLGFSCLPSQTNFLLCEAPQNQDAEALYQALKSRHILVRYFNQPRLKNMLRISVGSEEENASLLSALSEILSA